MGQGETLRRSTTLQTFFWLTWRSTQWTMDGTLICRADWKPVSVVWRHYLRPETTSDAISNRSEYPCKIWLFGVKLILSFVTRSLRGGRPNDKKKIRHVGHSVKRQRWECIQLSSTLRTHMLYGITVSYTCHHTAAPLPPQTPAEAGTRFMVEGWVGPSVLVRIPSSTILLHFA